MSSLTRLTRLSGHDVAVDLGSANTLVYVRGRGIVLSEPSLLAVDSRNGKVRAAGIDARRLLEHEAGSISAVWPIRRGAITDDEPAESLLRSVVRKVHRGAGARPRLGVVVVPGGATAVERQAVERACRSMGAERPYLVEEPVAAAVGVGLPVAERAGTLIVDIGAGTSEAAVLAMGEIVVLRSIRVGGDDFDEAIVRYLKRERNLLITQQTAEEVKREIGSAAPIGAQQWAEVQGHDARSAQPTTVLVGNEEIRGALEKPVARIVDTVKETLANTPPELGSDIVDRGMVLVGGGSLLRGLEQRLREETHLPAQLAQWPITCVATGSGAWLEEPKPINGS